MSSHNQHIIGRQLVDITLPSKAEIQAWEKRISNLFHGQLNIRLEELFDRYSNAEELIQINKLSIDLGKIDYTLTDEELANLVSNRLEEQLYSMISLNNKIINGEKVHVERKPVQEELFNQWLQFLEQGIISWQAEIRSEDELHDIILTSLASEVTSVKKLERLLSGNHRALERLILQYSNAFLHLMLESSTAKKQPQLIPLLDDLERLYTKWAQKTSQIDIENTKRQFGSIRQRFWKAILTHYVIEKNSSLQNSKFGELVVKVLFSNTQAGMPQFIVQELQKDKNDYPALGKLPEEAIENILKFTNSDDNGITSFTDLDQKREINEQPSSPKRIPENKNQKEVEPDETAALRDESEIRIAKTEKWKTIIDVEGMNMQDSKENKTEKNGHLDISDSSDNNETQFIKANSETKDDTIPDDEHLINEIIEGEGMYVHHAGIILVHPFLPALFSKLNLIEQDAFVDEKAKQRAIHLIQYLATGKTELPEYEMPLAKLLCTMPFGVPIDRFVALKKNELKEADSLLEAAIDHWGALGKISKEALRESFFQREGKLEKKQQGWHLNIEYKTIDILLQRLPWSISMIKFPWMPDMLRVEWA